MKLISISVSALVGIANGAKWNHDKQGSDWDLICATGKTQSPINLQSANSDSSAFENAIDPNNAFAMYNKVAGKSFAGTVQKGKTHGFKFNFDEQFDLGDNYKCSQWHCHFKSEHTIDDFQPVGECHLVCHDSTISDTLGSDHLGSTNPDALRVFGVMIIKGEAGTADNSDFANLIEAYNKATDEGVSTTVIAPNPGATKLWRYKGSLTTPTCNEVVHWTVFDNGVKISPEQAASITTTMTGADINNYRSTQPYNGRKVKVYAADLASCQKLNPGGSTAAAACSAFTATEASTTAEATTVAEATTAAETTTVAEASTTAKATTVVEETTSSTTSMIAAITTIIIALSL